MFKKFLEGSESSAHPISLEIQKQGQSFYCLIDEDQKGDTGIAVPLFELTGPDTFRIATGSGSILEGHYHIEEEQYFLHIASRTYRFASMRQQNVTGSGGEAHRTPMPGKVLTINVQIGDAVEPDQTLLIVEAMKMENAIKAAHRGKVKAIHCVPGAIVSPEDILVELTIEE